MGIYPTFSDKPISYDMLWYFHFTINIPQMLAYIPYMDPMGRGTPVIIHLLRWIFHGFSMKTIQRIWGNLQIHRAQRLRLLRMESMCQQSQDCYGWHLGDWISWYPLRFFHHGKGWKMIGKSLKMMENDWNPPGLTVKQAKNAECSVAMLKFQTISYIRPYQDVQLLQISWFGQSDNLPGRYWGHNPVS